jgi:hypothetical protein
MKQSRLPTVDYVNGVEESLREFRAISVAVPTVVPAPDMDIGRLSAEAVHQQYELAAKAVAGMGEVVKEHIARLEATLQECDADMKSIAQASAEIASKGKLVAAEIEHTNAIAAEIRSMVTEFKRKVGGGVAIVVIAALAWWAPPVQAQATVEGSKTSQRQPYTGPSLLSLDKDMLALALRDYGMWREEHDRKTFPTDMPKIGEPYDPVTGNAIRNKDIPK